MGPDSSQAGSATVGFSGATVQQVGKEVVKTGSLRLKDATDKQMWLRANLRSAYIPRVNGVVTDGDKCTVTMEHVDAHRLEDHVGKLDHRSCVDLAKRLANIVSEISEIQPAPSLMSEHQFLRSKLVGVRDHLAKQYPGEIWPALVGYYKVVDTLEMPADELPETTCHGDLAFDNILIDIEGRITLLDPLDQAYDSIYCDVAKVLQSTHIDWPSIRRGTVHRDLVFNQSPGLRTISHIFLDELGISWDTDCRVPLYLAVCLARIVPYAPTWIQQRALLDLVNIQLQRYKGYSR